MFKDEYRRYQEAVHAEEALIRRTLAKARAARQTAPRHALPVLAAVVCMLAMLILPQFLRRTPAADVTSTPPTAAPTFAPAAHATTFDGMTLRYLDSYASDGSVYILLSLQGDAVTPEMSLRFALSSEKTGQTFLSGTQQLDHDATRKISTFVVAFHEKDMTQYLPAELTPDGLCFPTETYDPSALRMLPEDDHLTLTLLQYSCYHYQPLEGLALEELTKLHFSSRLTGSELVDGSDAVSRELEMQVELAGTPAWTEAPLCTPMEGYHIMTAWNMEGQQLFVETQQDAAYISSISGGPVELHAWLYLLPRDISAHPWQSTGLYENVHAAKYRITWQGDETKLRYLQHLFPLDGIDLEEYMLGVYGSYTTSLTDVPHALSFTLGD